MLSAEEIQNLMSEEGVGSNLNLNESNQQLVDDLLKQTVEYYTNKYTGHVTDAASTAEILANAYFEGYQTGLSDLYLDFEPVLLTKEGIQLFDQQKQ